MIYRGVLTRTEGETLEVEGFGAKPLEACVFHRAMSSNGELMP